MKSLSLVLCTALILGVVVSTPADQTEGEESPVANPIETSPAKETPEELQAAEEAPVEDEESDLRRKRWYPYYGGWYPQLPWWNPYYGYGYGYRSSSVPLDTVGSGSFVTPTVAEPSGRTRFAPGGPTLRTTASLNELLDHNRRQEQIWQHQQWQRDQYFRNQQKFPDVIDTDAFNNFRNNFPNNFQNNFQNRPEVIDSQTPEGRTRLAQDMSVSPSGFRPSFAFNPNYVNLVPGFHQPYPFLAYR